MHELPKPAHPRRRAIVIAAAAVIALAGAGTAYVLARPDEKASQAAPVRPHVAATPTTTAPTATPTPTPSKPQTPHEVVAKAAPTYFKIAGPKFTIKAHVCGMEYVRPLDPPGEQHHTVCWVQHDFGVAPGSTSGTTYILGHSWAPDPLEVFNRLSAPATREILKVKPTTLSGIPIYPVQSLNGYIITLWTPKGTLRYKVDSAYGVSKAQAGFVKPLMDETTPNRVVIITCAELDGTDYDYNVIVNAQLVSSAKKASSA